MNRRQLVALLGAAAAGPAAAQQSSAAALQALEKAARAEGRLRSVGMPGNWANWQSTWADLKRLYGIEHADEDMNSAEEIARMEAEGANATIDIGDVGFEYAELARGRGVSRPHKPATWAQIPDWAKDAEGYWALAYTGTIAFAVNKRRTGGRVPRSWRALFEGAYQVMVGEVGSAAQANAAVLAAAIALGGAEARLQVALAQFALLAGQGKLIMNNPSTGRLERAEADVFLMWDFNALERRDKISNGADYEVLIPTDGSVTSGYTPIINKHAPHPNAALLAREYIFSDAGQINLALAYARPIRLVHLRLPEAAHRRLVDSAQYSNARIVQPAVWAWEAGKLAKTWRTQVLPS